MFRDSCFEPNISALFRLNKKRRKGGRGGIAGIRKATKNYEQLNSLEFLTLSKINVLVGGGR